MAGGNGVGKKMVMVVGYKEGRTRLLGGSWVGRGGVKKQALESRMDLKWVGLGVGTNIRRITTPEVTYKYNLNRISRKC